MTAAIIALAVFSRLPLGGFSTLQMKPPAPGHITVQSNLGGNGGMQSNSPWPKFQNNALNTGVSTYGGCDGFVRWHVHLGSSVFGSSPVIDSTGNIYIGTADGAFCKVDSNGNLLWKYQTGGPIWSTAVIGMDGTLYFGSNDGYFYAVSPNGTLVWKFAAGDQIMAAPTIDANETLYFGSWDGFFYALNSNGKLKWKYNVGSPIVSSAAIAPDGTLYFGSYDSNVYALTSTGAKKWQFLTDGPIYSSPAIASDGSIYIGTLAPNGDYYSLSNSGKKNWSLNLGGSLILSPCVLPDDSLILPSSQGTLRISSQGVTVQQVSLVNDIGYYKASPIIGCDGVIVFCGSYQYGVFTCEGYPLLGVNGFSGYADGFISSPAMDSNGIVYAATVEGDLYAFGKQTNTLPVTNVTLSTNSIIGGQSCTGTFSIGSSNFYDDIGTVASNNSSVKVISPIICQSGSQSSPFPITTTPVAIDTPVKISVTSGGITLSTTLLVKAPVPASLTIQPSSVQGSSNTVVTGTVTLSGAAPTGGISVSLTSDSPSVASVPSTLLIPAGATSGTFAVTHFSVTSSTTVKISAALNGTVATANLTVTP